MIEFINKGKVVNIEYDDEQNCYVIKMAKKLTLQPKQKFVIKTKTQIKCSHELDECVLNELVRDDLEIYMVSDKYSDDNPEKEIEIIGFYNGDEVATIEKGESVACLLCYHRCTEENMHYLKSDELENSIIFANDKVKIQSIDGTVRHIETVVNPDGTSYAMIPLQ